MILYLDASALVKRYVFEPGSDLVRETMHGSDGWFICRVGFVEVMRAVALAGGRRAARAVREEWQAFEVIEVDPQLVEHAAELAVTHELRSLDALHLAAALVLPRDDVVLATWDHRLHRAAHASGLRLLPPTLG